MNQDALSEIDRQAGQSRPIVPDYGSSEAEVEEEIEEDVLLRALEIVRAEVCTALLFCIVGHS